MMNRLRASYGVGTIFAILFIAWSYIYVRQVLCCRSTDSQAKSLADFKDGAESSPHAAVIATVGPQTADEDSLVQYNASVSQYDARVQFWGKVVDQDNMPLEGVDIAVSVVTLRMIKTPDGLREFDVFKTKSAADGTFMFDGGTGMSLHIEGFQKDGYVLPSAYQYGIKYGCGGRYIYRYVSIGNQEKIFTPSPARPEVFHMWKLRNPEPLYIRGEGPNLSGFDLKIGDPPVQFHNFSLMVQDIGTPETPEWEVTVAALEADGGVVKADPSDIFMFQAPESGYRHAIKFRYGREGTDQGSGDPGALMRFFARSHEGRWHSAGEFVFFSPESDGTVVTGMRYWLNPSGSRNLEHDGGHPLRPPRLTE